MAKEDYFFPLLYKRLLTSTIGWKDDEFCAYVRLLIHQFDNNNRIPNDLNELVLLAPSIKKNWQRISKKFKEDENADLYNEVMSDIYDNAKRKKNISRQNGQHGGRPKKTQQVLNDDEIKTQQKPTRFKNDTEKKPDTINNKQYTVNSNTEYRNTVVENGVPPQQQFSDEKTSKLFQMFKNCSKWNTEIILEEVGKFKNKYPELPLNKSGPVVNTWVANYKPAEESEPKKQLYNFTKNGML
jgi:uncharacterized protein YdaU (DUF1376 family)